MTSQIPAKKFRHVLNFMHTHTLAGDDIIFNQKIKYIQHNILVEHEGSTESLAHLDVPLQGHHSIKVNAYKKTHAN